jgi:hypothetical protein
VLLVPPAAVWVGAQQVQTASQAVVLLLLLFCLLAGALVR